MLSIQTPNTYDNVAREHEMHCPIASPHVGPRDKPETSLSSQVHAGTLQQNPEQPAEAINACHLSSVGIVLDFCA